jgi:hypothetical protein
LFPITFPATPQMTEYTVAPGTGVMWNVARLIETGSPIRVQSFFGQGVITSFAAGTGARPKSPATSFVGALSP